MAKMAPLIANRDSQAPTRPFIAEIMSGASTEQWGKSRRFMSYTARILQEIRPQIAATFPAFRALIGSLTGRSLGYNTPDAPARRPASFWLSSASFQADLM
jgi:hypothetical protein